MKAYCCARTRLLCLLIPPYNFGHRIFPVPANELAAHVQPPIQQVS